MKPKWIVARLQKNDKWKDEEVFWFQLYYPSTVSVGSIILKMNGQSQFGLTTSGIDNLTTGIRLLTEGEKAILALLRL